MAFDLTTFELCVRARAGDWDVLGLELTVKPVSPNHGKALAGAEFVSEAWLAVIHVWETGELELEAARIADRWVVATHYDIEDAVELDHVLAELIALVGGGAVPAGAVSSWLGRA